MGRKPLAVPSARLDDVGCRHLVQQGVGGPARDGLARRVESEHVALGRGGDARGTRSPRSLPVATSMTRSVPSSLPFSDTEIATRLPSSEGSKKSIVSEPLARSPVIWVLRMKATPLPNCLSADQVAPGMEFKVINNKTGDYLGAVVVDSVEPNEATGRLSGPRISEIKPDPNIEVRTQL